MDRLENRCNRFVKGSKKYKEGVKTMAQTQLSFADFLEEFCGGTDEESMILGMLLVLINTCGLQSQEQLMHHTSVVSSCPHAAYA